MITAKQAKELYEANSASNEDIEEIIAYIDLHINSIASTERACYYNFRIEETNKIPLVIEELQNHGFFVKFENQNQIEIRWKL